MIDHHNQWTTGLDGVGKSPKERSKVDEMLNNEAGVGAVQCSRADPTKIWQTATNHRSFLVGQLQQLQIEVTTNCRRPGFPDRCHDSPVSTAGIKVGVSWFWAEQVEQEWQDLLLVGRIVCNLFGPPLRQFFPVISHIW